MVVNRDQPRSTVYRYAGVDTGNRSSFYAWKFNQTSPGIKDERTHNVYLQSDDNSLALILVILQDSSRIVMVGKWTSLYQFNGRRKKRRKIGAGWESVVCPQWLYIYTTIGRWISRGFNGEGGKLWKVPLEFFILLLFSFIKCINSNMMYLKWFNPFSPNEVLN